MKVLDLERKGNLIRFYLGSDDLQKWYGDDWDDYPYELNAGPVYSSFVKMKIDVVLPYEVAILDACEVSYTEELYNYSSSAEEQCKLDYINSDKPFVWFIPDDPYEGGPALASYLDAAKGVQKVFLGMNWEKCCDAIEHVGGLIIKEISNDSV